MPVRCWSSFCFIFCSSCMMLLCWSRGHSTSSSLDLNPSPDPSYSPHIRSCHRPQPHWSRAPGRIVRSCCECACLLRGWARGGRRCFGVEGQQFAHEACLFLAGAFFAVEMMFLVPRLAMTAPYQSCNGKNDNGKNDEKCVDVGSKDGARPEHAVARARH